MCEIYHTLSFGRVSFIEFVVIVRVTVYTLVGDSPGRRVKPVSAMPTNGAVGDADAAHTREREFFIDNLLVRIRFIIVMIRWTG